ncbi:histidine phosphotransferase family protein [Planktotalea sp.]|uniref:histidine phosphotransferase family protein n=1 Tax=Planktotalea sp. TaxID=2029877 RepID=UPI0035C8522B
MGEQNLHFSALVGSRICHDLISPIGAINNGMELLSMSGTPPSPEMALISQSVEAANARIRFFRIAFGAPSETQFMGRSEVTLLLRDITRDSRLFINWIPNEDMTRTEVQLAFLTIQCAEQALPYGGQVNIERVQNRWQLTLEADRINLDTDLWATFEKHAAQREIRNDCADNTVVPAHVQFVLLPMHAHSIGRQVRYTQDDTKVVLTV